MKKNKKHKKLKNNNILLSIPEQPNDYVIQKDVIMNAIMECYHKIEEDRNKKRLSSGFLKIPLAIVFYGSMVILLVLSVSFLIGSVITVINLGITFNSISQLLTGLAIAFVCFLYAFLFWKVGKEIDKETDKNYLATYFSAIIGLIALVIAVIALFR